jgi:glucokinase-like ROK family protein
MPDYRSPANNPQYLRKLNQSLLLELLRAEGTLSRAEIARRLDVSRVTISSIIDDLINRQVIVEKDNLPSSGGRRAISLELLPEACSVIGVSIGVEQTAVLAVNLGGAVLADIEKELEADRGPLEILPQIADLARAAISKIGIDGRRLAGVGLAFPSPVLYEQGRTIKPSLLPGWENYPLREELSRLLNLPVYLENDANLGAYGEFRFGAGKGETNLAYISIGAGIGAGLVLNEHIYHGQFSSAGEIGHVTIEENGPPCRCGNFGCLETVAGNQAVARRAQGAIFAGQRTALTHCQPYEAITARDVAKAARDGDPLSRQILFTAGKQIGLAVSNLINILSPGLILIGGEMAEMSDIFLEAIRGTVRTHSLPSLAEKIRIEKAALGYRSIPMGAAALALQAAIENDAFPAKSQI